MRLPDWKPNKLDILLCAVLILCAVLSGWKLWFAAPSGRTAVITVDGRVAARLPLDTDAVYEVDGDYHNVVRVRGGKVMIESSDCPGKDCVRQGAISKAGRSIVCLPNRVTVTVEGGSADVIVG